MHCWCTIRSYVRFFAIIGLFIFGLILYGMPRFNLVEHNRQQNLRLRGIVNALGYSKISEQAIGFFLYFKSTVCLY
jgi:hypothetical protein